MKVALAFMVKAAVGEDRIEARELVRRAMRRWGENPGIEILGHPDPDRRVAIVSFNIRDGRESYLHLKFVTTLLNDLFGIQSRAGCSCAGPYDHALLGIDEQTSLRYRSWILRGYGGVKPGWCRVGFHYVMDDGEADYVIDAVDFVARRGHVFLTHHVFDVETSQWSHLDEEEPPHRFSLAEALDRETEDSPVDAGARAARYARHLAEAEELVLELKSRHEKADEEEELLVG